MVKPFVCVCVCVCVWSNTSFIKYDKKKQESDTVVSSAFSVFKCAVSVSFVQEPVCREITKQILATFIYSQCSQKMTVFADLPPLSVCREQSIYFWEVRLFFLKDESIASSYNLAIEKSLLKTVCFSNFWRETFVQVKFFIAIWCQPLGGKQYFRTSKVFLTILLGSTVPLVWLMPSRITVVHFASFNPFIANNFVLVPKKHKKQKMPWRFTLISCTCMKKHIL